MLHYCGGEMRKKKRRGINAAVRVRGDEKRRGINAAVRGEGDEKRRGINAAVRGEGDEKRRGMNAAVRWGASVFCRFCFCGERAMQGGPGYAGGVRGLRDVAVMFCQQPGKIAVLKIR